MGTNSTNSTEKMLLSGRRLQECRKEAQLTQQELAEKIEALPSNNGRIRSEKHISAIERGERSLSEEYAMLISEVLYVRPEYLLGEDEFKTIALKCNTYNEKEIIKQNAINFLIRNLGYTKTYASDERYMFVGIRSSDTDRDIEERLIREKEYLEEFGEREMILEDTIGRRIHIYSGEMERIYEDIEFMIKCRIEREFEDVTKYAHVEDTKNTFKNPTEKMLSVLERSKK